MKSKKLISIIISLCMVMTGIMCCLGCDGEKPYVDTSNAAVPGQFDNPETAKAKEAEDDAAGREHIEIPEGAETIEIDGEIYYPIDSLDIDSYTYGADYLSKNYILTGDVDITGDDSHIGEVRGYYFANFHISDIPFTGKFNGNNYKIYGESKRYIFDYVKDAEISNFVLSSDLTISETGRRKERVFCARAENSVIKNIINYSRVDGGGGLIANAYDCKIENIVNYGDGNESYASIIGFMWAGEVKNCKNYGNFTVSASMNHFGAIVGRVWHQQWLGTDNTGSVIENCENYGNLIGVKKLGGIVGEVARHYDYVDTTIRDNSSKIINCTNHGNLYRNKNSVYTMLGNRYGYTFSYIGGIVGMGSYIENCTNHGHIYGFESIDPTYIAEHIGGIAGVARAVTDCINNNNIVTDSNVKYVDNICGEIF